MESLRVRWLPHICRLWRCVQWQLKKHIKNIKWLVADLVTILVGSGIVVGIWYLGFVWWPRWSH